jgi:hypothetical protein
MLGAGPIARQCNGDAFPVAEMNRFIGQAFAIAQRCPIGALAVARLEHAGALAITFR